MYSCGVEKKCGACQLSNMNYERQLHYKQAVVVKLLKRFGHVNEIIGMDEPYHYRNKAQFAVRRIRGNVVSGIYQSTSGSVIVTDKCFLNDKTANDIVRYLRRLIVDMKIAPFDPKSGKGAVRHIMVRNARSTGEYMVVLVCFEDNIKCEDELVKSLVKKFPEIKTIVLNVSKSAKMTLGVNERILFGSGTIEDVLCGKRFEISSRSFYQINPIQTEKLYSTAVSFAGLTGGERILDAYCGIGTIGISASDNAGSVVGVEQNGAAVADARINAEKNGIANAMYIEADAAKYMHKAAETGECFDVVFVDPPRAGCSREFLTSLAMLAPEKVVYISCDPKTLARDLTFLTKNGFRVRRIQPVDMFPHTGHVETVVLMTKK